MSQLKSLESINQWKATPQRICWNDYIRTFQTLQLSQAWKNRDLDAVVAEYSKSVISKDLRPSSSLKEVEWS